ncbi:hypothetical protein [Neobacillus mesonae]|uniref:hypothetical protein n=1 Tax=Neobacillus mesonae TaxID=1193713 RepID=UPI002572E049|nr:hypothetical protein [Neobacillus mesonae]
MMGRIEPSKQFSFEFDEQGTNMVSEQIMDSYNSGFIDHDKAADEGEDFFSAEG